MPSVGSQRVFEDKFKFIVEIDGVSHAGFQKCSALEIEIEKIQYREGGRLTPHQSPGLVTISDITMERGAVVSDTDLYDLFLRVVDTTSNTGEIESSFRVNFDIVVLERDDTPLLRWRCRDCWVTKFVAGEWDNDASEKTITMVTFAVGECKRVAG